MFGDWPFAISAADITFTCSPFGERFGTADQRVDACDQIGGGHRLGQIVVSTLVEGR